MFRPRMWIQTERWEPLEGNLIDGKETKVIDETTYFLAQRNEEIGNALSSPGRLYAGYVLTGLASGGFTWVMAGSTTTAIDTINNDRLGGYSGSSPAAFEYIANGVRKKLQSTAFGGNITTADWTADNYTDGLGNVYRQKLTANVTYGPGDANGTAAGVPLQRYGLNLHSPTPTTVEGYSGIMFNELIDSVAQTLTTTNQVIVNIILRI